jgi:transcriptional regulator with XRE-family HTH domain
MLIREKIKLLRQSRKWSQEYLAEKLGMSTNGYGEIERGGSRITVEKLEELSRLFEIPVNELYDDESTNIFIAHNNHNATQAQHNHQNYCTDCSKLDKHDFEKMQLVVEKLESLVESQKAENAYLKEIIELMKK